MPLQMTADNGASPADSPKTMDKHGFFVGNATIYHVEDATKCGNGRNVAVRNRDAKSRDFEAALFREIAKRCAIRLHLALECEVDKDADPCVYQP